VPKRALLRSVNKRILVVAVAAAILSGSAASAASAKHAPKIRLPLVPLQTAQLGPAGASLPIEFDSGPVRNGDGPSRLKKLGRLSGYLLDYGDAYLGGAGVTSIATQVERFRTTSGAKKGLKFWKKEDKSTAVLYRQIGVTTSAHFFKVRAVGSGRFAYVTSLQIPNADPLFAADEEASSGSYVLHATVMAGTESTAERLAPVLMRKLVHRLRQMLDGKLRGKPAKLPKVPQPGPPPGGPDLSTLVLGPSDFTGPATVVDQGYDPDPSAVSTYGIDLHPAGPFDEVQQTISWDANANVTTWQGTLFSDIFSSTGAGNSTIVDLSAVGDNAHGVILTGAAEPFVFVIMWQGQALDLAIAQGPATIQPSDVQTLAQAMATHLNAGLGG
jgi:hypothetical protein